MTAQIISGKELSKEIRAELKDEVTQLKEKGITPGLAVILVGEDPASQVYVRNKGKACEKLGIHEVTETLPADTSEEVLLALVEKFNKDPTYHGILVQLPLPKHIDESKVLYAIDPIKDVDGFHPVNVGKLMIGDPYFLPCTPHGIQEMLLRSGNDPARKHVVVVGRSNIVGKPIANILLQKKDGANATVTICHTGTDDIAKFTREADIVIAATGWPNTVTADMVKDGVVVIDVGVNRVDDPSKERGYRLVGDVDFEGIKEKAAAISPVPGGVGPMTITMLMKNTVRAAKLAHGIED
ncbi:MAG: bifunctional methylenetetrahydrofolate dehydrogenase/methenyltetrahydrofolate cyclohydrolase FolD [Candidatus Thermoplasmatota archaeon]|nr:bifunctional methylenetetrahydrofolate dehydrogenase/methenyltetrahydrofolate cyclohydrolase FolD [Candidatus Thermoplasmatota archaeon]